MKTSVLVYNFENIEVYVMRPLPRTKKILYRAVKFEVGEEDRIVGYESFY